MTCRDLGGIIICSSPATEYRRVMRCRSCRSVRRHLIRFGGWHGDTLLCLGCGAMRNDGWIYRQSTARKRRRALEARTRWSTAQPASGYDAAVRDFLDIYCPPAGSQDRETPE